jgi:hypothetical protein
MTGQERGQMRGHADRTHAGAAAAVRDAEGLVQVQVADVGADVARAGEPDLRVHVGAVHVHLAAVLVHDLADLADRFLEDAVCRRVRDHERGELVAVLRGLGLEVGDFDVPLCVAGHGHDLEAGDGRAGRVRPVRGDRDQADVTLALSAARVIGGDDKQPRVFTLRARVRL